MVSRLHKAISFLQEVVAEFIPLNATVHLNPNRPLLVRGAGYIDSRMWDPEWKAEYGASYNNLTRALNFAFNLSLPRWQKDAYLERAQTLASEISFYWGKGSEPTGKLSSLKNLSPGVILARFRNFFTGENVRRMAMSGIPPLPPSSSDIENVMQRIANMRL